MFDRFALDCSREGVRTLVAAGVEPLGDKFRSKARRLAERPDLQLVTAVAKLQLIPKFLLYLDKLVSGLNSLPPREGEEFVFPHLDNDASKELCSICRCSFTEDYEDAASAPAEAQAQSALATLPLRELDEDSEEDVVQLVGCAGHFLHVGCLKQLAKSGGEGHLKCPVCTRIFGVKTGDQPPGSMDVSFDPRLRCEGFPAVGTLLVQYHFPHGKRGDQAYRGTSRLAYLPATEEGTEVCLLLMVSHAHQLAFRRRLTFTVGTSLTTGMSNVVIWNSIHHKTSTCGGSSCFGYPDATYFNRVKLELAANGVYTSDISEQLRQELRDLLEPFQKPARKPRRQSSVNKPLPAQ